MKSFKRVMWAIAKELAQNNYKLKTKESDWSFMFEFGKGKLSGQMLNKIYKFSIMNLIFQ